MDLEGLRRLKVWRWDLFDFDSSYRPNAIIIAIRADRVRSWSRWGSRVCYEEAQCGSYAELSETHSCARCHVRSVRDSIFAVYGFFQERKYAGCDQPYIDALSRYYLEGYSYRDSGHSSIFHWAISTAWLALDGNESAEGRWMLNMLRGKAPKLADEAVWPTSLGMKPYNIV